MGIFSAILDKLRHLGHGGAASAPAPAPSPQQQQFDPSRQAAPLQPTNAIQGVDVDAVLSQLAAKKGGGGNYRTSIVDLLKLLDLDSSLDARKQLATELNVNAGAPGTAEQNIALQKAVMRELAANGGKVPDSLRN
jgi:hypothetical protein